MSTEKQTNKIEYEDQAKAENRPKMGRAILAFVAAMGGIIGVGKLANEGYANDAREQKALFIKLENEARLGKLMFTQNTSMYGENGEPILSVTTTDGKHLELENLNGMDATELEREFREAKQGQEDKGLVEGK